MENKYPVKCIRAVNYSLIVLFFFFSIWFIPSFASYLTDRSVHADAYRYVLIIFGWLIALPCEWVLVLALHFSSTTEDPFFTRSTARVLKQIAVILSVDCSALLVFSVVLFFIGERLITPLLLLLVMIGLALAYLLGMLSGYIVRAADMKEEADATL